MERLATKNQTNHWSQVGLEDYSLVAFTDGVVTAKIIEVQESFYSEYKHKSVFKTLPHITIANFTAREAMEETLFRYMQRILMQQSGFEVALNNYGAFPPHEIFLRIQNQHPFKQLAKELKVVGNYVDSCSCPPMTLVTHPHVDIAKGLPETLYLKAMMNYSQKTFHETFLVNELVLLRRSHQYDACKTVQVFQLQPPGYQSFKNTLFN